MIINELRNGERVVSDLVKILKVPQAVVSRHLAHLRNRGVLKARREGTSVYYSLADPKIVEACDLVHQVLLNRLAENKELAERFVT